jgi:hypothetical protein
MASYGDDFTCNILSVGTAESALRRLVACYLFKGVMFGIAELQGDVWDS